MNQCINQGDFVYQELRKNIMEIENVDKSDKVAGEEKLMNTLRTIVKLGTIARKEGLLALEEATYALYENEPTAKEYDYLIQLLSYVVDGTDPEIVNRVGTTLHIANNTTDYASLQELMCLQGALMIQFGENILMLQAELISMFPKSLRDVHMTKKDYTLDTYDFLDEEEPTLEEKEVEEYNLQKEIDEYCAKEFPFPSDVKGYQSMCLADYIFNNFADRNIQRCLREINTSDVAYLVKGLSGTACRHIFDNMSPRLAAFILQDVQFMGRTSAHHVVDYTEEALRIITELIRTEPFEFSNTAENDMILATYDTIIKQREASEKFKKQHDKAYQRLKSTINTYEKFTPETYLD